MHNKIQKNIIHFLSFSYFSGKCTKSDCNSIVPARNSDFLATKISSHKTV